MDVGFSLMMAAALCSLVPLLGSPVGWYRTHDHVLASQHRGESVRFAQSP